ncbi:MAG TPA: class I SAM-dependent methyltransferase [Phycisphaerales bacterium]|nr:class I SAM-dependent methyltransferase [Phycisphaerales bacterium]
MSNTPLPIDCPRVLPTREGYDLWSEIYDGEGNPLITLEEREVAHHLGDVRGLSIADIGCGTGRHSARLAMAGAKVTGVDFSHGMLSRAGSKPGAERVTFIEHDINHHPLPLNGRAFDRVICALVVDHIADLRGLFGELGRICRAGGSVLVTVMHPAMMLKGVQARFTDPATGLETRPQSVANTISDYVTAALGAGLRIAHISEHAVDEDLARTVPRAAKYLGWPMLLVMKLST